MLDEYKPHNYKPYRFLITAQTRQALARVLFFNLHDSQITNFLNEAHFGLLITV